jgi:serine/threonine protein kinase
VPVNTEHEYNYKWGLDRFIQEARTLARFSHPNIVRVNRFLEANNTSYMVMDYEAGESLNQYLRRVTAPDEATLKQILMPILDGLQAVHQAGFLHRDIKPSNVFMRDNGVPVLLDFGSARLTSSDVSKNMTTIVTPGYAPLEQYTSTGNQGPWTDIYALSGVMYRAVTGANPPDAVSRMKTGPALKALEAARTRYSERFLKAIEWGLVIDEKVRPQSIAEWRDLFIGRAVQTATSVAAPTAVAKLPKTPGKPVVPVLATGAHAATGNNGKLISAGSIAVLVVALSMSWEKRQPLPEPLSAKPISFTSIMADAVQTAAESRRDIPMEFMRNSNDQTDSGGVGAGAVPRTVQQEFEVADRDGDGYLDVDEVKGRFPYIERNFALVDSNRDGRISPDEFLQLRRRQHVLKPR